MDAISGLDGQIAPDRLAELKLGHADKAVMDIHELRHVRLLTVSDRHDFSLVPHTLRFIGQLP
jgi:hypothetical protein